MVGAGGLEPPKVQGHVVYSHAELPLSEAPKEMVPGTGLAPVPLGYEPNELATSLPRYTKRLSSCCELEKRIC